jgi:hypothetical protein
VCTHAHTWCSTSIFCRMVAPSLEMVTSPSEFTYVYCIVLYVSFMCGDAIC